LNARKNILLVEDDPNFGSVLKAYLEMNGFIVSWIDDGKHALKEFSSGTFDICVLDVMLPNVDGYKIAREIRELNPGIPFIYVTAKTLKEDILKGYSMGADDYITKPFDSEVMICKINAILNRATETDHDTEEEIYTLGKYIFNPTIRELSADGYRQKLSPKESDLLKLLYSHKNSILPREIALRSIWGEDGYFTTRSMDVYITKLRKYLKRDPNIEIINIHGNGFRMLVPEKGC
jgi:DNA-binding response OmpR family regulator